MIYPIHVIACDRLGCTARCTPEDGSTPGAARYEAKQLGWTRIRIPAGGGSPAHIEDRCPEHATTTQTAATKEQP